MLASRFAAALAALSLSLLLSGCGTGRLHILIPDFIASGVDGLRLFRVVEKAASRPRAASCSDAIVTTATGLQMEYTQFMPGPAPPGARDGAREAAGEAVRSSSRWRSTTAGAPAFFRFASYNETRDVADRGRRRSTWARDP